MNAYTAEERVKQGIWKGLMIERVNWSLLVRRACHNCNQLNFCKRTKLIMRLFAVLISCVAVSSFASIAKTSNIVLKRSTMEGRMPLSMESIAINGGENDLLQKPSGGSASIATSTFNLAKSVIGAGVLSLPSGVAFLADEPSALLPAAALCTLFGAVAAYSFSAIGKICKENDAKSFQEAWEKIVSPNSAWLISGSITALCFLASLAYCIIMGDSFSSLFQVCYI